MGVKVEWPRRAGAGDVGINKERGSRGCLDQMLDPEEKEECGTVELVDRAIMAKSRCSGEMAERVELVDGQVEKWEGKRKANSEKVGG